MTPSEIQVDSTLESSTLRNLTSPVWAAELYEHMRKYRRFQSAYMFWDASPRMVKAIIKHPMLVIALHQRHVRASKAYDPDVSECELQNMFEKWGNTSDSEFTIPFDAIDSLVKLFESGLTPMQAVQQHYAEVDDGDELSFDDAITIYGSSGTLMLKPLMALALILVIVVALLRPFDNLVAH